MSGFDEKEYIKLRGLQQYSYCPKRWGLININCDWQDNALIAMGDILHGRVNDEKIVTVSKSKITERAVVVQSEKYSLTGKIDALELTRSPKGAFIQKYQDKFEVAVVEYKKAKPKNAELYAMDDAVQVYGQKLCIDEMLGCDAKMFLYYFDVKKRVQVENNDVLKTTFFDVYKKISDALKTDSIPDKQEGRRCDGCSFKDICLPHSYDYDKRIEKVILEENEKIT